MNTRKLKKEAFTPDDVLLRLVEAADQDILIGGQALAIWVERFGLIVRDGAVAISNDVDFLTRSAAAKDRVAHFARVLGGKTHFPSERALTVLVGQAYLDISEDEYLNVDVLFKLIGLSSDEVRLKAIEFSFGEKSFLVMHPLHVLKSRLVNLYKLTEKQNDKGVMQLGLSIQVARSFLHQEALGEPSSALASGRSPIQQYVSAIAKMARDDAGRKVAARYGLHVADAIDPSLIPAGPFWEKAWPSLQGLMSPAYAGLFEAPAETLSEPAARLSQRL